MKNTHSLSLVILNPSKKRYFFFNYSERKSNNYYCPLNRKYGTFYIASMFACIFVDYIEYIYIAIMGRMIEIRFPDRNDGIAQKNRITP